MKIFLFILICLIFFSFALSKEPCNCTQDIALNNAIKTFGKKRIKDYNISITEEDSAFIVYFLYKGVNFNDTLNPFHGLWNDKRFAIDKKTCKKLSEADFLKTITPCVLQYENYRQQDIQDLALPKSQQFKDIAQLMELTRDLKDFEGGYKVSEVIQEKLMKRCFMFGSNLYYGLRREEFLASLLFEKAIEYEKEAKKFYDLGEINLSAKFETRLIVLSEVFEQEQGMYNNLYLINIAEDKVKSMAIVGCYSYIFAEKREVSESLFIEEVIDNKFLIKSETVNSGVVSVRHCWFSFDDEGYVVVHNE